MNKLKKYLLYVAKSLKASSGKINDLLNAESDLSFDAQNGTFTVTNRDLTPNQRADIRRTLMGSLRHIMPTASVKIDDVITGYYDQCLERYLYERINRSIPNENTCWFKFAQNNRCIGWVNGNKPFDSNEKTQFLNKLGQIKPALKDKLKTEFLEKDINGYIFRRSNKVYEKDDKILSLCETINKNGFSNIESALTPIILGYSTETKRYSVISGRHRVAALRYLRTQGLLKESLKIKCHLINYPFDSLVVSRPYKGHEHCAQCDWGGIFDPGTGTHQDFYMREGIAIMRGHKNRKGGKQKWNRMQPVFQQMVSDKKVLDVGAYRGMYCIKALEYGAKHATALEPSASLTSVIDTVSTDYALGDLNIIEGDFFNEGDYKTLVANKYDTVFLLGIIHHLLRLGIQNKILYTFDELLQRISAIASHGIIVEFALPKEASLILPEIAPHRDAFSQSAFERAIQKYFPQYKNLGHCNYNSGNKYGRFMYYAVKQ